MPLPWLVGGIIVAGVINVLADDKEYIETEVRCADSEEIPKTVRPRINKTNDTHTVTKQVPYSKVPQWARK